MKGNSKLYINVWRTLQKSSCNDTFGSKQLYQDIVSEKKKKILFREKCSILKSYWRFLCTVFFCARNTKGRETVFSLNYCLGFSENRYKDFPSEIHTVTHTKNTNKYTYKSKISVVNKFTTIFKINNLSVIFVINGEELNSPGYP